MEDAGARCRRHAHSAELHEVNGVFGGDDLRRELRNDGDDDSAEETGLHEETLTGSHRRQ